MDKTRLLEVMGHIVNEICDDNEDGDYYQIINFFEDYGLASSNSHESNALSITSNKIQLMPLLKTEDLHMQDYVEQIIPLYSDALFKSQFRMARETFNYIFDLITPSLISNEPDNGTISLEQQFLIAIWKMITTDSYRSISQTFNVGVNTVSKSVRMVTKAILQFSQRFIAWPEGERVEDVSSGFCTNNGIPRVMGAIGGRQINIKPPKNKPAHYLNKKGQHSMHLQAVCDHQMRFTHCLAGHEGSLSNQQAFRLSEVKEYLNDPQKFPDDTHLLGDAGYTMHKHLLVPYSDNGHLTNRQKNYNLCHASARTAIKRAFALLKCRFRSLSAVVDMKREKHIPDYILACCTLHNICLINEDELQELELSCYEEEEVTEAPRSHTGENVGHIKRDLICSYLPMRNI